MGLVAPKRLCWLATGLAFLASLGLGGLYWLRSCREPAVAGGPDLGCPSGLPLPSSLPLAQYEEKLFDFLNTRQYVALGWLQDKHVRDTGPFIDGKYYGTHPAVRVYYSPGIIRWLKAGRSGPVPDGEMIIKEQFPPPAARHEGKTEKQLWASLQSWTVMVKDSAGSHDGWFWSNPSKGQCVTDNHRYPFDHPVSGFGHYCVRCHAATQSPGAQTASRDNEFTFASLRNITGFPGEPILFRVDDSWRKPGESPGEGSSHPKCAQPSQVATPKRNSDPRFLDFFRSVRPVALSQVQHLPPVTHDWSASNRDPRQEFVTSNQCMSCHAGLLAPFGPSMFVPAGRSTEYGAAGWDVSPYGEWRWTPMGLAGRDPVFHAQVESELRMLQEEYRSDPARRGELSAALADTCLRCHGAAGRAQHKRDHGDTARFSLGHVQSATEAQRHPGWGDSKYGALARDGVTCMICHRMQPRPQPAGDSRPYLQHFLETSTTGNFHLGPKGEIYGPFKDDEIAPYAMEHATGLKPKHSDFLKSSQLCGSCHAIALPLLDMPLKAGHADELVRGQTVPAFRKFRHHVEQATYLEWLNSEYENEINKDNPRARTCQDCHMSRGLRDERHGIDIPQIQTRIAAIQDTTYPDAENLAPHDKLSVRVRDTGYRRHNFSGLNVFLLEMFNQFDDVLGVPTADFMTGSKQGPAHAADHMARTARDDVASLEVRAEWEANGRVTARVVVRNKVGHRFPSGVGFRRAFLELLVLQPAERPGGAEQIVWASGRTNELGVLVGADGRPLPTEFFSRDPRSGRQRYQKHHEVITSPDQVQVYETLLHDAKGGFTTSFVRGCTTIKDNRLLPRGWKPMRPGPGLTGKFLAVTHPGPEASRDPRYQDGSGSDEVAYQIDLPRGLDPSQFQVRATLYYQAIPPYYLRNLFETAPDGDATRRLHYLCSNINLKGTPIEGWKLRITTATSAVRERR